MAGQGVDEGKNLFGDDNKNVLDNKVEDIVKKPPHEVYQNILDM